MRQRAWVDGGLLAAGLLVVAGCVSSPAVEPSEAPTPVAPSVSLAGLEPFYGQQLDWQPCDGIECATLKVPVDYAEPEGPTLDLSVVRRAASGDAKGAVVINPGGPGSSGVAYARAADVVVSDALRDSYDIVGFDPRGVGESVPVECVADAELDALIDADATPDTPAEIDDLERVSDVLDCASPVDGLLEHLSTPDAARDLDVLRSALGQERLDYLGVSYGTHLGATYAALFPERVGRFVLDGPLPSDLDAEALTLGQALGFEDALRRFIVSCQESGDCPFGDAADAEAGLASLRDLLDSLDARPAPTDDPARPLTESAATYAILLSLYRVSDRPLLRDALASLMTGDGTPLRRMLDERVGRQADGSYRDNALDAFYAVSCRDREMPADVPGSVERIAAQAPFLGEYLAWGNLPCLGSPVVPAAEAGARIPAILVVATTHDPATPFMWAEPFVDQLGSGAVLLVREGDGHTAYREGSACIDEAIDAYFIDGRLTETGTVCD